MNRLMNSRPSLCDVLTVTAAGCSAAGSQRRRLLVITVLAVFGLGIVDVQAQDPTRHYLYDSTMPPGAIGQNKILMRPSLLSHSQCVRIVVPDRAHVAVYSEGSFQQERVGSTMVGLMVGQIYRLKITHIPGHPGREVYPSVEVINRLYPPQGKETICPVEIHLPIEDLEPALQSRLVTRIVYLEDPNNALPERQGPGQRYFDVSTGEDPIRVAEKFGRPMAIVRIGSRLPDAEELDGFGFGAPPVRWISNDRTGTNNEFHTKSGLKQGSRDHQVTFRNPTAAAMIGGVDGSPGQAQHPQGCLCQQCPTLTNSPLAFPRTAGGPKEMAPWRDELLIDGGDRALQAVITDDDKIHGLDSEDTIGHFDTLDGRRIVDASNRVAIYAPRFAAVRSLGGLGRTKHNQIITRVRDRQGTELSRRSDFSTTTLQNLQPNRHKTANLPRGLETQNRGVSVDNTTALRGLNGQFKTYENLRLIKHGKFDNAEKGRLAIALDRVRTWENNLSAQSTIDDFKLIVVDDVSKAQTTVHVKTEKGRPQLRLVKVASTDMARPGDEVEFTIRFDNVGDELIGNVTIIDKLTTRLEYIDGSAECSIEANFSASPNEVLSQTLRWEIKDPLKVSHGGIIRFKCRVR